MKNINDQTVDEVQNRYIDAKTLKNMTLTQEELYQIQKENICDNLMSSMVSVATKNGQSFYAANLLTSMQERLMNDLTSHFTDLGYKVQLSEALSHKGKNQQGEVVEQEYKVMTLSWNEA